MTLHADLVSFIERHRPRGALTGDASASVPTERGYLLTVACSCGVTFERWITPAEATADMVRSALLALPN